jgi:acetylornithine deacetylase/succinyl-diaminopimelate desuccinylase-like protein
VTVSAALGTGASDSRFLRRRGVLAYGLGLLPITLADALEPRPHGPDERVPVGSLATGVQLLGRVVRELAE